VGDDSHFVFRQKLLGEDGSVRRRAVMVKLRHGACSILSSEPVGMSHNQFPPPQQCREWSVKNAIICLHSKPMMLPSKMLTAQQAQTAYWMTADRRLLRHP
jgi:hypothetical protein